MSGVGVHTRRSRGYTPQQCWSISMGKVFCFGVCFDVLVLGCNLLMQRVEWKFGYVCLGQFDIPGYFDYFFFNLSHKQVIINSEIWVPNKNVGFWVFVILMINNKFTSAIANIFQMQYFLWKIFFFKRHWSS